MSRVVVVIQARMSSSRLPGKVLMPLGEMPVLGWCVRAARAIAGVDEVVVATSDDVSDDAIATWCAGESVMCVRGSLDDVLGRFVAAVQQVDATNVLRLTADCPLLDPDVCGAVLALMQRGEYDYVNNTTPRHWPDGLDCEAFTASALFAADAQAKTLYEREHVTPAIRDHHDRFSVATLDCPLPDLQDARWTLDYKEDYEFFQRIVPHLPKDRAPSYLEVLQAIKLSGAEQADVPDVSVPEAPCEYTDFSRSQKLLQQVSDYIPQASQTYSKSAQQFPAGHAPLFLTHGQGGRVWDVDGNEYVDLVSGLLPVMLGYADPDVDAAIRAQLQKGISFSLPTMLEMELAKHLRAMIPCAQSVRYGKNGSDVTAAAIRVARAYTGRERVMVCGYHGWQDWYIGATSRHKGVPKAVQELTHAVAYNDIAAVDVLLGKYAGEFAALMMEPVNVALPDEGYFTELQALLKKHGVLLIFDEVITGFRLRAGGAQEYFGVEPDMACFGKAMANGMPLSALAGRKDVMAEMEHIFFSGTFGGEALSLAASIAVCEKIAHEPVIDTLWQHGKSLRESVAAILQAHDLQDVVKLQGLDPWVILDFLPQEGVSREAMKTFFITQMARYGVLILNAHNVCYAHSDADLKRVVAAYEKVMPALADGIKQKNLEQNLACPVVYPAFTVR